MIKPKYRLLLLVAVTIIINTGFSQDLSNAYGVGTSFGIAIPRTDIDDNKESPIARAFFRYYPSPGIGLEAGFGLGTLEAEKDPLFFTSSIYPFDFRFIVQPVTKSDFIPYFFGGVGTIFFNPKDKNNNLLKYNARGDYNKTTTYFPIGVGGHVLISKNTSVGISGTYNYTSTKYLDDIKSSKNDSYWSITLNLFAFLRAENPDLDGDKLLNNEEKQIGTDPLNPDTDGDRLKDGEEVHTYKTNPLIPDTDGDGLTDGDEVLKYRTNPLKKDTDGDGLTDGDEVLKYYTDPLKVDTDGDGLTDGDEVLKYRTNPLKVDTDGDGLSDGDEVLKYRTDPLKVDTDGDGLNDGDEVLKHRTDPLKIDTDGGGMPDGKEVQLALNPLDSKDDVPIISVGERIILEGVNFETAKTTLLPNAKTILDQVAVSLIANSSVEVAIYGHTDNVGGAKYNMELSTGRAEAVKAYLVSKGIDAKRITTKGFGFTKPIEDNSTPDGRAKNRRIEFVRIK
ncbi:MAG: OmpA family protein [Bacteroidota bacterium]|nr:OmpA family protein [Bacteroidota bacterium]